MVPAAEDKRLSLILVVPCQGIGQGVIVVFHGGMDRHSGRFVDHQDVFIFINNVQGKLYRWDFLRGFSLADTDL